MVMFDRFIIMTMFDWFANLTNRLLSEGPIATTVNFWVPQGSILRPLISLFIRFNCFPNILSTYNNNMFSDDTELHYCHGDISTVEHTVQSDLESISIYLVDS